MGSSDMEEEEEVLLNDGYGQEKLESSSLSFV